MISGALDRLHYEQDPCVRYDNEKKLWIYLHKDRPLNEETWKSEIGLDFTLDTCSFKPTSYFSILEKLEQIEKEIYTKSNETDAEILGKKRISEIQRASERRAKLDE